MPIKQDEIRLALSLITTKDENISEQRGNFVNLSSKLHLDSVTSKKYLDVYSAFKLIHQDLWKMEAAVVKITQENEEYRTGEISVGAWLEFAPIYVDYFNTVLRTCFDHVALAVRKLPSSHTSPISFNNLQKWVANPENMSRINPAISTLVSSCKWFSDVKDTRDLIIHEDGSTLVFIEDSSDKILFQTYGGWKEQITIPELMYNSNVVIFNYYAGLYLCYLLSFLEKLSKEIDSILNLPKYSGDSWSQHSGLFLIEKWANELLLL
jgi:hypothetical protein